MVVKHWCALSTINLWLVTLIPKSDFWKNTLTDDHMIVSGGSAMNKMWVTHTLHNGWHLLQVISHPSNQRSWVDRRTPPSTRWWNSKWNWWPLQWINCIRHFYISKIIIGDVETTSSAPVEGVISHKSYKFSDSAVISSRGAELVVSAFWTVPIADRKRSTQISFT